MACGRDFDENLCYEKTQVVSEPVVGKEPPMRRREFLKWSAGAGMLALFQAAGIGCTDRGAPPIDLPDLPYPADSLEPYISERTLAIHHGRHHRGYVEKTLRLAAADNRFAVARLEEIVKSSSGSLFNAAAQAWNHQFYWKSMAPGGGGPPSGPLLAKIRSRFDSYDRFVEAAVAAAADLFGSGWLWLVDAPDGPKLITTSNAGTPITAGIRPLLVVDLWEHAYYLDYQDRRGDYVRTVFTHLINWDWAEENWSRSTPR